MANWDSAKALNHCKRTLFSCSLPPPTRNSAWVLFSEPARSELGINRVSVVLWRGLQGQGVPEAGAPAAAPRLKRSAVNRATKRFGARRMALFEVSPANHDQPAMPQIQSLVGILRKKSLHTESTQHTQNPGPPSQKTFVPFWCWHID